MSFKWLRVISQQDFLEEILVKMLCHFESLTQVSEALANVERTISSLEGAKCACKILGCWRERWEFSHKIKS